MYCNCVLHLFAFLVELFLSCAYVALHTGSGAGENDVKLPAFLATDGGINSGFMIAHCTSAALGV